MRRRILGIRRHLILNGLLVGGLLGGCGGPSAPVEKAEQPAANSGAAESVAKAEDRMAQSFAQATRAEPPEGWHRPPDQTLTGKATGVLYTEVVRLWDTIQFRTATGRSLEYSATLDTEFGPIEITLRPDLAPSHVRNFVALAKAGFFDGLVFQRTVREKVEDQPDLELIEGGCPLGTGEAGHGSIGYWLHPEFSKEPQEEGTVGACHADEPDSAACKFYVLLSKAPVLEGHFTVFGKVTAGLDNARKIHARPVRNDPEFPEQDRPERPVVIRKVTVQVRDVESVTSR